METKLDIKRVGSYTAPQAVEPGACQVCHNALWGTIIVNGVCLECMISKVEKQDFQKVFETLAGLVSTWNDVVEEPGERARGNYKLVIIMDEEGKGLLGSIDHFPQQMGKIINYYEFKNPYWSYEPMSLNGGAFQSIEDLAEILNGGMIAGHIELSKENNKPTLKKFLQISLQDVGYSQDGGTSFLEIWLLNKNGCSVFIERSEFTTDEMTKQDFIDFEKHAKLTAEKWDADYVQECKFEDYFDEENPQEG